VKCRVCNGLICVCESCIEHNIEHNVCEHVVVCNDCAVECSSLYCSRRMCRNCLKRCKHCLNGFCFSEKPHNDDSYHARQCVECNDYACCMHAMTHRYNNNNVLCFSCAKDKIDRFLGPATG
jgi:hypothetical protein